MAGELITLERLTDALNSVQADMEPFEIRKLEAAIRSASAAARAYTNRDFTLNEAALSTTRTFEYDDSGYIDIDDAQTVTAVNVVFPYGGLPSALTAGQWEALPYDGVVKDTLILYGDPYSPGVSREMGFTYNLDRYEGPFTGMPPRLEVTAVWGWPAIPEDVQQAVVWAASAFAEDSRQITSESIEGFSRSRNSLAPTALPLRSRDLLDQYRRIVV